MTRYTVELKYAHSAYKFTCFLEERECHIAYLEVTVVNPAENASVWIVWHRLEYPATGFVLAAANEKLRFELLCTFELSIWSQSRTTETELCCKTDCVKYTAT